LTRAVFLDRDGVINQKAPEGRYVTRWEDFHILPGVVEGITLLNRAGYCVVVVTNQRCVAKGIISVADLETLHQRMSGFLAQAGATIDAIYYCPHEVEQSCICRKPEPGMLLQAASSQGLELPESWMIGDSDIDVQAGKNAGCKTIRLLSTNETVDESGRPSSTRDCADIVASSLLEAVRQLLQREGSAVGSLSADPPVT
jgi:D-glycero-D-manno-heptose 1,7-bisphosphate phosphatase